MTEEALARLLAESPTAFGHRLAMPPEWLLNLEESLGPAVDEKNGLTGLPTPSLRAEFFDFLVLIEPFIRRGRAKLRADLASLSRRFPQLSLGSVEELERLLLPGLPGRLLRMIYRTLILELNVARLQGLLSGDTPQERYQSFIQRLRQPEVARSLLEEYPVLARQAVNGIRQWSSFGLELLERLHSDLNDLQSLFSPDSELGPLVEVVTGLGDTHRDGRSVSSISFGSGLRIIYKPRPLAAEAHFQQLLEWINVRGDHPPFRTLKTLARAAYGWMEFVSAEGCGSHEELGRFFERQGGYLALLYTIEATDFHSENLIACGEHPVLTDLESLFQSQMRTTEPVTDTPLAERALYMSLLRIGMLPGRAMVSEASAGIDMSGLSGGDGQLWPHAIPSPDGTGDEIRIIHKHVPLGTSPNRPTLSGSSVNATHYADAITKGFTNIYRMLMRNRAALLADEGPLKCFEQDEIRIVLRTTYSYALLLRESYHPDVLREALERDRFFDKLWVGTVHQQGLARFFRAERADLHNGDIPLFNTQAGSRDVWTSNGERFADVLQESGMARAIRRVENLSEDDLERQRWLIQASLTTLAMGGEQATWRSYPLKKPAAPASRERLLAGARAVGDRLDALALQDGSEIGWIGLTLVRDQYWALTPAQADLYSGLPGIALFLAYLGKATNEERYTLLARRAIKELQHYLEPSRTSRLSLGGYFGWGGLLHTFVHLRVLWEDPSLDAAMDSVIEQIMEGLSKDDGLDVTSGAAGAILALLNSHRLAPSGRALEVARRCGDHLLTRAQAMPQGGLGWPASVAPTPLTGLSHGAAGIGWALLELASATGDPRYAEAGRGALAFERTCYLPEVKNWRDLRVNTGTPGDGTHSIGWCHGAAGIGMARVKCLALLDDPVLRAEIDHAVHTTLHMGFGGNHSLCHGDLGNLELALLAALELKDASLLEHTYRNAAMILDSIDEHGWLCGVPLGVENPALMTGLAGIGFGLLRLAQPEHIPSILMLEPPRSVL